MSRTSARSVLRAFSLVLAAIAVGSCAGGDSPSGPPSPATGASIRITSDTAQIFVGDTVTVSAKVILSDGKESDAPISWQSSDPSVISIDQNGRAAANSAGLAQLIATSGSLTGVVSRTAYSAVPTAQLKTVTGGLTVSSTLAQINTGTMQVIRPAGAAPIAVGDVLLGTAEGGYLRKVTAVSGTGTTQNLTTVQAELGEAYTKLNAKVDVVPNFAAAMRADYLRRRGTKSWPEGLSVSPTGEITLANLTQNFGFTQTLTSGPVQAGLTLNGNVGINFENFSGELSFEKFLGLPYNIKRLRAVSKVRFTSNIQARATLTGNFATLVGFPSLERQLVDVVVGTYCPSVCFTVHVKLIAYIEPFANVDAELVQTVNMDYGVQAGADFYGGAWHGVYSRYGSGISATTATPDIEGSLGVEVGIKPRVEILVLNAAGPHIGLDINGKAEVGLRDQLFTWFYAADAGAALDVGATINIFGIKLAEYNISVPLTQRFTIFSNAGPAVNATLSPAAPALSVAQSQLLTPTVRTKIGNISLPPGNFTCTSSNPAIVSASGCTITGVATGSATITAQSAVSTHVRASVPVTVAPAVFASVSPSAITATHVVSLSPCPQGVGTLSVTNTAAGAISFTATRTSAGLTLSGGASWSVSNAAPGSVSTAPVAFTCSPPSSVNDIITISVTGPGGVVQTYTVPVTVTVQQPLITLAPPPATVTHIVGTSPCPQMVGTVTVTNASAAAVSFTATGPTGTRIFTVSNTSWSVANVAAGASVSATVWFSCVPPASVSDDVVILVTNAAGASQTFRVRINVNVVNPLE